MTRVHVGRWWIYRNYLEKGLRLCHSERWRWLEVVTVQVDRGRHASEKFEGKTNIFFIRWL